MSIDRIGKGGGVKPPATADVGGSSPAKGVGEAFRVAETGPVAGIESTALARLRSGGISVSQYLDANVHEATSHLSSKLSPDQLDFMRASLREQLASDPLLADLVKAATGSVPPPGE